MEKSIELALSEFMELTGHYQCQFIENEMNDYGILLDDKIKFFICNGNRDNFGRNLNIYLQEYKTAMINRKKYINCIQEQLQKDNKTALSENLHTVELVDIDVNTEKEHSFLWPYAKLKINGLEFQFVETALCNSMRKGNLLSWSAKCQRPIFTAGAVKNPDFIFGNVRFSSTDNWYKILPQ